MVNNRLQMIFTHDEIDRITVKEQPGRETLIIADVHGMKCRQARRFINIIINAVRIAFQLKMIFPLSTPRPMPCSMAVSATPQSCPPTPRLHVRSCLRASGSV